MNRLIYLMAGMCVLLLPGVLGAGEATTRPHVLFVIGEPEYNMAKSLPAFAKAELEPRGARCTFIIADEKAPNDFVGLENVKDVDLMVLGIRRRTPSKEQLAYIKRHLELGKAMMGLRVASHAFAAKPPDDGHEAWETLDVDVFGGHYEGHYGKGPASLVQVNAEQAKHPVVAGLPEGEFRVVSHLYRSRNLAKTAVPLLNGRVEGKDDREPVAWTNQYGKARVFYTSLGGEEDFASEAFRRMLVNAVFWAVERPVAGK